jgi:hypothetical protein
MISAMEIRSRARELGVPETTIERDYLDVRASRFDEHGS